MTAVFVINLDHGSPCAPNLLSWLSTDERRQADAFAIEQLANRFIAARLAMRIVLGDAAGCHPSELIFTSNAWGRPELPGGPYFNLTHTGGLALLAVDQDAPVGIDAEATTEAIDEATMSEFLSPEEAVALLDRESSATRLWVRKEALLKAYGRGLSIDPKTLTVGWHAVDTDSWRSIAIGESRELYSLIDINAGDDLIAALARLGGGSSNVSVVPFTWPE